MKKLLVLAAALTLLASPALAVIEGSLHDFSSTGGGTYTSGTEICVFCHTPHNADTDVDAPLWNHNVTEATFTPYASDTYNSTGAQPGPQSLACLACHDGTVAVDSYVNGTGSGTTYTLDGSSSALIGNDLTNDHPVGALLIYDEDELQDPATAILFSVVAGVSGKVECASCHDVHEDDIDGDGTPGPFLIMSNANSALCLDCHVK